GVPGGDDCDDRSIEAGEADRADRLAEGGGARRRFVDARVVRVDARVGRAFAARVERVETGIARGGGGGVGRTADRGERDQECTGAHEAAPCSKVTRRRRPAERVGARARASSWPGTRGGREGASRK